MNTEQRSSLIEKVLQRNKLHELQSSRLKRILKDPIRTIPFFLMNLVAHIMPYKVNYTTLWGDHMSFYLPEGNAIYYYGFFEANLTNFFINALKPNNILFDIGAHVGYYSVLGSSLVEKAGSVHSFEPTPRTYKTLTENVIPKGNVITNNMALMDRPGEIEFVDYGPKYSVFNTFKSRTSKDTAFLGTPEKITVKTTTLDAYCELNSVYPDFIKIDAEGAESLILKGGEKILTQKHPVISIEVGAGDEWKENNSTSISYLQGLGYLCFEINLRGKLQPHIPQPTYLYDNLVFIHPSKTSEYAHLMA